MGYLPYQRVQDFFHQQYQPKFLAHLTEANGEATAIVMKADEALQSCWRLEFALPVSDQTADKKKL